MPFLGVGKAFHFQAERAGEGEERHKKKNESRAE